MSEQTVTSQGAAETIAHYRVLPVVVLDGLSGSSIAARAREEGCAAVLMKPCLPDDLPRHQRWQLTPLSSS